MSHFFIEDVNDNLPDERTPKTNLGCESEFGFVTNDFRKSGNSTSLETISKKHIVSRNKLYEKERWISLSNKEKRRKWYWAKNSPQAKAVMAMEKDFKEQIKGVQLMASRAKENLKQKKVEGLLKVLEECKKHGGPLCPADIHKLDELNEKQIQLEASYLKKTIAPQIRFKRKVDGKFLKFTTKELMNQIKDAVKPSFRPREDIDTMINSALSIESQGIPVGTVAWWTNELGEGKIGVLIDDTC